MTETLSSNQEHLTCILFNWATLNKRCGSDDNNDLADNASIYSSLGKAAL